MIVPLPIASRDNPLIKRLRLLAHDTTAYRKQGQVWLEGEHLCQALLARGGRPALSLFTESHWPQADTALRLAAPRVHLVPDALMGAISGLESPASMGFVWDLPSDARVQPGVASVVLDRLQDAGNVGSILRSAAAMGFGQVLAIKGTAALWSPKVLRSGMGAHFALNLIEGLSTDEVAAVGLPLLVTSSHEAIFFTKPSCLGPALGYWGTRGRAWRQRWPGWRRAPYALRSQAARSR